MRSLWLNANASVSFMCDYWTEVVCRGTIGHIRRTFETTPIVERFRSVYYTKGQKGSILVYFSCLAFGTGIKDIKS